MNKELNKNDYIKILKYYNVSIPKSIRLLKKKAEEIMGTNLCRCIKKVDPINESKSIGICTKSVINSKGFTRGSVKCKGKQSIKLYKSKKNKTQKKNK
jgi:hypothetical protein